MSRIPAPFASDSPPRRPPLRQEEVTLADLFAEFMRLLCCMLAAAALVTCSVLWMAR